MGDEKRETKPIETLMDLLKYLRQEGVPKEEYKRRIDSFLEFKSRKYGVPFEGHFELTPLCNLDCRMCYVHLNKEQMQGAELLTVEQWKSLMRQAKEAGMRQATLSGGECLTYPGFDELYLFLQDIGIEVNVFTNGILLTEERVQFFQQHPPKLIQISLYGCDEESYERVTGFRKFQVVFENIKRLQESNLGFQIAITPNESMDSCIEEILDFCHSQQLVYVINNELFKPREETGRGEQVKDLSFERYFEIFSKDFALKNQELQFVPEEQLPPIGGPVTASDQKGLRCGAGRSVFAIQWDGTMLPCAQMYGKKQYPLEEGFLSAWKAINHWAEHYPRIAECEGCAYEDVCSPCAAKMAQYVRPGMRDEAQCELTRNRVKYGLVHTKKCGVDN